MGLDMYLTVKRYIWYNEEDTIGVAVKSQFTELPEGAKIKNVDAEIGYWRKANAIHKWFVDNVQDGVDECQETQVDRESITKLREACQQVIAKPELAEAILPTQSGFFFGGTHYDQWYMSGLADTVAICDAALALPDTWDLHYRASW